MTHYPAALEEDVRSSKVGGGLRASAEDEWARLRKERARWWVRRLGMLAACGQLGTAFAATRALRTTEARQRLVDMDLRSVPDASMHEAIVNVDILSALHATVHDAECAASNGFLILSGAKSSEGLARKTCAALYIGAGQLALDKAMKPGHWQMQ